MDRSRLSPPAPIQPEHELADFTCGEPSLDDWLRKRALKNQASGASRCFVVAEDGKVIGYYTLSAGMIERSAAPRTMRRQTPNSLPVLLLGRMAVDRRWHNQGIGQALLRDALLRSLAVSAEAGVFALLVHALSEPARRFYLSRGFVESPLRPMTLMMTLETIRQIVRSTSSG